MGPGQGFDLELSCLLEQQVGPAKVDFGIASAGGRKLAVVAAAAQMTRPGRHRLWGM